MPVVAKKRSRAGRPRNREPSVPVSFRLPKSVYDAYAREALKSGNSVNQTMRDALLHQSLATAT
ncbi:hypothetical protein LCGC14_1123640 [marine sediment metagenome]|uniref:Uncharacterized protein n=1 Tax=marine sediment metagenome TaxID=412755 RepID=A0A0F9MR33_9ZZZZ